MASDRSACASLASASSSEATFRLAENTRVWFSSRLTRRARSSQAMAVLTLVSASRSSGSMPSSILFAEEELARGDDDRLISQPVPALAQGLEHADEVAMREPRARREAELGFDVLLVVQQHAARRRAVPPGTPGLLQVVLQRAGDVGVHDEADVGLVHAHAEGVGRDDHAQRARDEVLLDLPLGPRLEPGVEVRAGPAAGRRSARPWSRRSFAWR